MGGDDLVRLRALSLGETLSSQPGISATYFGPQASRPVIRGLGGERVQMSTRAGSFVTLRELREAALADEHGSQLAATLARHALA